MTTPELIQFVKNEIANGVPRDLITIKMKTQGWSDFDIIEVFNIVGQIPTTPISVNNTREQQPVITPHRKSFGYLITILVVIVLLVGGFVIYASGYFTSPSKLFSQSVSSLKNSTGVTMDIELVADASNMKSSENSLNFGSSKDSKIFNFNAKSSVDLLNKENLKSNINFSIKAGDTEIEMESRVIDGMLYMSLKKAPDLGFLSLKPFENKWVSLPYKNNPNQLADNSLLSSSGFGSEIIKNLTEDQKQHIYDITSKASFMKITKNHLPEVVDGSLSYHFDFDLDYEGITAYFKEMITYLKSIDKNNSELDSINASDYNKIMDSVKNFKGEAWIGIFDHLPHKIVINGDLINIEKPNDGSVKLSTTVLYSDWNKPVVVEIPSSSSSAQELLVSIFGTTQTTDNLSSNISIPEKIDLKLEDSNDVNKKSIMSNMTAQASLFYRNTNSYLGFCRSKTEGAYPLAITLPKNSVYKCNDEAKMWASWVQLSSKEYWCADSTGLVGISKTSPKGTTCGVQ